MAIEGVCPVGAACVVEAERMKAERFAIPLVVGSHGIGKLVFLERGGIGRVGLSRVQQLVRSRRCHPTGKGVRQQGLGDWRKHEMGCALSGRALCS